MVKKNRKIKLNDFDNVFFDLDGTLLDDKKQITEKSLETINELKKENKKIAIATGRPFYFAKEEIEKIQPDFPVISCNGALIYDYKNDKVISYNPIVKNASKEIMDILIENEITFLIYTTKEMFAYSRKNYSPEWFKWLENSINSRSEKHRFKLNFFTGENKIKIENHDVIKFLIIKSDSVMENVERAVYEMKKIKNIYFVDSQTKVIDVMPIGSSKGIALQILSNSYNIDLERTVVFGDADNDIPMFEIARYSVAMGQSEAMVKLKATYTTSPNNKEGIFDFFKNIYLKKIQF